MTPNTYADRMAAYGYTPEQTKAASDRNHDAMRCIATVSEAGRKRGTIDHTADIATVRATQR
jgi:hypothetical protein